MKRGEMQKKFFRFLDRLPYFPFYRTIVLNVKVKRNEYDFLTLRLTIATREPITNRRDPRHRPNCMPTTPSSRFPTHAYSQRDQILVTKTITSNSGAATATMATTRTTNMEPSH